MIEEVWKDVVGYEDYFRISSLGRVYSKRTSKILKQCKNKAGYYTISSRIGGRAGKAICLRIHRLIAEAFIPNPANKPFINHINGIKTDNSIANLEWVTAQENIVHAYSTGLIIPNSGEKCSRSKLTQIQVDTIRKRYKPYCKKDGVRAIAKEFGLHHSIISRVVNNKTY